MAALLNTLNDWLYSYLLIGALIGCALWFTFKTKFLQFRYVGEMCQQLVSSGPRQEGRQITSYQAFIVSLAGRVGTGNIAGVATALALGGVGAVCWMWLIALLGAATAFLEGTLAQLYKQRAGEGYIGGPAYYMLHGLGNRRLAVAFALMSALSLGLVCNSVHNNTICMAFQEGFGLSPLYMGVGLAVLSMAVFMGGIRRIAVVSSYIVPFMALGYVGLSLYVTLTHLSALPDLLLQMVREAFDWQAVAGGGMGAAFMQGVKRGLYSNEAGWGTAPNVAATAEVSHPVKQGLIQSLGVFVDTLIICSATAFIVMLSGLDVRGGLSGIQLTQQALASEVGSWSVAFVAVAVFLFAFSTLLSNYYYGETNLRFITSSRWTRRLYQLLAALMVLAGALLSFEVTWSLADLVMGLMTLCNLYALVRLFPQVLLLLRDWQHRRAASSEAAFTKSSLPPEMASKVSLWDSPPA